MLWTLLKVAIVVLAVVIIVSVVVHVVKLLILVGVLWLLCVVGAAIYRAGRRRGPA